MFLDFFIIYISYKYCLLLCSNKKKASSHKITWRATFGPPALSLTHDLGAIFFHQLYSGSLDIFTLYLWTK